MSLPMLTAQKIARNSLKRAGYRIGGKLAAKQSFGERYFSEPAAFVVDCIDFPPGEEPAPYQLEILTALAQHKRAAARGPHGLGKSALASWAILWFALTRDSVTDWKNPSTASVWRQLTKFLWPEVKKWAKHIRWDVVGRSAFKQNYELQSLSLKLLTGEAFGVASDEPSAIEGAHATQLLYIFDESKAIPVGTWDAAEGAFSNAGADTKSDAYALAISTPGETSGRFYDIQTRRPGTDDWWVRHVTLEEAIAAGRISREWSDQRRKQWGESSAIYQNRVLGEFADSGEDSVIPLSWVEKANERWIACEGKAIEGAQVTYGVDPARYGQDSTGIGRLAGNVLEWLEYHTKESTMETAGRVMAIGDRYSPIGIDTIGIGAGVYDRLHELGLNVIPVNVSENTDLTDGSNQIGFFNLRSAIWWMMREALDPENPDAVALPIDDILTGDLTAPLWKYTSKGKIQVESKDDIRARIGRSTDAADTFGLAYYAAHHGATYFEPEIA